MGSIPGPIISFRISQPELAGAVQPAFQQIRQQAQTVSNQIADDWKRMAAQIRASVAQGISGDKEVLAQRTQLLAILDRQLSGYNKLNEISTKELSILKAMTLERERQANAIKTGTVGVTAGTNAALGQASQQAILGIGRVLDSLVNRYLGGAAGAAFRTGRDVQYYGAQAGGGLGGGLSSIFSSIPGSTIAAGALAAAVAAVGIAATASAKDLIDQNEALKNTAAITGLTTREVQKYNEAAKLLGLDAGTVTTGLSRLQAQLGDFIIKGKEGREETGKFVSVLHQYGVEVTDSSNHLRPAGQILSDFAQALRAIPDQATRTAVAMDALGGRNRELAALVLRNDVNFGQLLNTIDKSGLVIGTGMTQTLDKGEESLRKFELQTDSAKKQIEEFLATGFFKGVHIVRFVYKSFTNPAEANADAARDRIGRTSIDVGGELSRLTPTAASAGALADSLNSYYNGLAGPSLRAQQVIAAGGEQQYKLIELRKQFAEEEKTSQTEKAAATLKEINQTQALIDLEKKRTENLEKRLKLYEEFGLNPSRGNLSSVRDARSAEALMNSLLNPGRGGAPDIGIGSGPSTTNYLAGIVSPAGKPPLNAADLLAQINKEHEDLFRSQASIDAEHYQDELDSLNEALKKQLISQQEYSDAVKKLAMDRNKTLADADKKYEDEAGGLFESLISGKTRDFAQTLLKDVENIALGPVKKIFEQLIGSQLQALSDLFSGKKSAGGTSGGIWGTITGKIGGVIGPGGTPGWWPGAIGGGAGGGIGGGPGQVGTMNVAAQVVYLTTLGVAQTGGGPGGGLGNFFGANSLLGGFGNFFGNLNPFGGSGSPSAGGAGGSTASVSTLGRILSAASPFAAGAAALGLGLATGNESTMAIGAAALAGKASTLLSGISGLPSGLSSALSTFGQAAPGLGIAASGIINAGQARTTAGKLGGTLEAGAGGALAGLIVGGPIGAAIGGAIGLIAGGISSIFGGGPQGFQQSVTYAMAHNQYHAPLSENFSFASNGSIANTLRTGFQQNGSSFSQYALPANTSFAASALTGDLTWQQLYQLQNSGLNPNAPFLGNPSTNPYVGQGPVGSHATSSPNVNVTLALPGLIDANQIASTLAPHITSIAQMVSKQVANSSSGFASNVRRAAFPP
jgi:hypothetical protein